MKDQNLEPGLIEAKSIVQPLIRRTPLERSEFLSRKMSAPVFLKLENLQVTGSFKIRGALYHLATLPPEERSCGVATCSAGNHGWALAYAGKEFDVPVTVFVPASVDPSKKQGIENLGASVEVTPFEGFDDAEEYALDQASRRNLPFISAYDDWKILLGNGGTLGDEIFDQLPEVRTCVTPVGGGGLAAGLRLAARQRPNPLRIVGCQLADSPALHLSLERGEAVTRLPAITTRAGGIEGGIGKLAFSILQGSRLSVSLVTEEQIESALCWMLRHHHYLIEPSSAAAVAACLSNRMEDLEPPIVVILTGRNIDWIPLAEIVSKQLTLAEDSGS